MKHYIRLIREGLLYTLPVSFIVFLYNTYYHLFYRKTVQTVCLLSNKEFKLNPYLPVQYNARFEDIHLLLNLSLKLPHILQNITLVELDNSSSTGEIIKVCIRVIGEGEISVVHLIQKESTPTVKRAYHLNISKNTLNIRILKVNNIIHIETNGVDTVYFGAIKFFSKNNTTTYLNITNRLKPIKTQNYKRSVVDKFIIKHISYRSIKPL